jgi:hypothetical protein
VFLLIHFVTCIFVVAIEEEAKKVPKYYLLCSFQAIAFCCCKLMHGLFSYDWILITKECSMEETSSEEFVLDEFVLILLLIMQIVVLACEEKTKIPWILSCAVSKLLHFVAVVAN